MDTGCFFVYKTDFKIEESFFQELEFGLNSVDIKKNEREEQPVIQHQAEIEYEDERDEKHTAHLCKLLDERLHIQEKS